MRRLSAAVITVAAASSLFWASPSAVAEPRCKVESRVATECLIEARDVEREVVASPVGSTTENSGAAPGKKKSTSAGPGSACIWEGTGEFTHSKKRPVPCTSDEGIWSNRLNCYVSPAPVDPQPPASASEWDGHVPGDGAVYSCYSVSGSLYGGVWLAEPPSAADAGPSPGEVAQMAVERMNLRAVDIGMSPEPDGAGVVGYPTWLWVQNPSERTVGPITRTASAGSVTVSATARLERIVWDMGDGTQVECTGPGTPYQARYGRSPSPDCGHTYTRESGYEPGGRYTVTATSEWTVQWRGAGQSGSLDPDALSRSVQVSVGEAQVLVR